MSGRTAYLSEAAGLLQVGGAVAGLAGDALGFVLAETTARGRWLLVVDAADRADQLVRALRFFSESPGRIERFPADDNRPYDGFAPDPALPQQRMRCLERVNRGGDLVVVATARALLQRVPTRAARALGTRTVRTGDELDRDALSGWLTDAGYLATSRADSPGRFTVRGDVLDVWPAAAARPLRLDFFDDEVESLRRLDPATLRPHKRVSRATLLPAAEERLDAAAVAHALEELGRLVAERGAGTMRRRRVVEDLRAGVRFSAVQDWLPALVPTEAPVDALGELRPVVVSPGDVAAALRDFESTAKRRYTALDGEEQPLVSPAERFVPVADVLTALNGAAAVHDLPEQGVPDVAAQTTASLAVRGADLGPVVSRLVSLAGDDARVALVVDSHPRAENLLEMLGPHGLQPRLVSAVSEMRRGKVALLVGDLPRGFVAGASGWAFVPVSALFGTVQRKATERGHALFETSVTSMSQLKEGDPVVHRTHGVGRYLGLQRIEAQPGVQHDFVRLEYKGGDEMFLPVADLRQLSRYAPATAGAKVALDRLGGRSWEARKGKVRDHLLGMAHDLLRLYARREVATRAPYSPPGARYRTFEARFPHEETPDQANAINAVLADLERGFPMDRLICGDVGFGKTEVAMRAAMRAVETGKQVAVLCPTTVLAYQHHRSFVERFAADPDVRVGMLSRFVTPKGESELLSGLSDGGIQIVVGTTALLGRRVRYDNLGLIVVDEEHRFGVRQKDRLKRMRTEVDILSMSATPIPRTMQMALSGVREMSIIATPPLDRLSVRTTIAKPTEARYRDAITTELARGGQVYVIHNRVESIGRLAEQLREWVPDARFSVAHGQLDDVALEEVLVDFIEGRSDVLVSTSIVESGVDLPNVNTMLIHRADRFGIAQLYQLRGRVGRSDRRANCLLLVPEDLSKEARRRLRVIVDNQSLGSGFHVAAADLELRGGGNLLGAAQSGNIDKVGYATWLELLRSAVHAARGDQERDEVEPEIEVPVDAFLPDVLVRDPQERLGWYQRLANAQVPGRVEAVLHDLEAEFGDLPDAARNLGALMSVRLGARALGVERLSWLKVRLVVTLHPATTLTAAALAGVVERHPKRFTVEPGLPVTISVRFTPREALRPLRYVTWVLAQLERGGTP